MTETVVHVTTLEQWKSVLDVWFKQGYTWEHFYKWDYLENVFSGSSHYLHLDDYISQTPVIYGNNQPIEYSEFMAQQKEDNKMAMVYEVSQSAFDELRMIKAHEGTSLIGAIVAHAPFIKFIEVGNKAIIRYLADDPAIEFKVKEPLYRLWAIDRDGDKTYFDNYSLHAPATDDKYGAFTAPLEEIKKWNNQAWSLEKVD
ncbi:hypothetical protein [Leuconostoc mesenteroides]|uniref:hypothetical protein n=1 Tax=Leuconostoc mesenteroides TaxID=1245 RepID=UPI0023603E31|nr:hypothetical protein [Leuconostoc mesenteroides]